MSFPTFTPQRPNAALYKFNVGESFLKGYQTVANVDLERAAEARMLEKNRLDAQIATQLLPLQADKLRAEIGLLGAQADRQLALAKYAGTSTSRQSVAAEEAYRDEMARLLIEEQGLSVGSISPTFVENPSPSFNLETPITPLGDDEQFDFGLDDNLGADSEVDDADSAGVFGGLPDAPQQLQLMRVSGAEGPELPKSEGQMTLGGQAPLSGELKGKPVKLGEPVKLNLLPDGYDADEDGVPFVKEGGPSANPLTNLDAPTPIVKPKSPSQIYTDYMARQRIARQVADSFSKDKNNMALRVQNRLWQEALVKDQQAMDGLYAHYGLDFQTADAIMKQFGGVPDMLDRAVQMRQLGSVEDGVPAGADWDVVVKGLSNQQTRLAAQLQQQNPSENKNIEKANTLYSMMEKEQDPEKRQGLGMIADALIKSGTPPEIQAEIMTQRQNNLISMTQFLSRPELNYLGEPIKDSENKIDAETKIQQRAGIDYPVVSAKILPDGTLDLDDNGLSKINNWYGDKDLTAPEGIIPLMGLQITTDKGTKIYPVQGAIGKDKNGTSVLGARESYMQLPKLSEPAPAPAPAPQVNNSQFSAAGQTGQKIRKTGGGLVRAVKGASTAVGEKISNIPGAAINAGSSLVEAGAGFFDAPLKIPRALSISESLGKMGLKKSEDGTWKSSNK